ncbi:hypothetical protein SERLA73DRAFT_141861 [Serpula lacrymans var. lacrymans S7.3]|uniref:Uncharacterized protein n=2 Tax=Serpula lacrymans var. lacrymans TaxID=341189 RepID=F8Q5I3_SERL3|nr:uncharacterized protein SERLADRAFT_397635 [Serpula lacrymans var. lacrymans S7.9]EGN96454.1 hypothetical protein SERLA73DRAFT_141861 [Serpula lacrymans var. lacrymans S7.3]EGO22002.1 hypothetical protein SERLADRAFT_397635 [Serpula lacrymans var. lacrymans S7.9]
MQETTLGYGCRESTAPLVALTKPAYKLTAQTSKILKGAENLTALWSISLHTSDIQDEM